MNRGSIKKAQEQRGEWLFSISYLAITSAQVSLHSPFLPPIVLSINYKQNGLLLVSLIER